LSALKKRPRSSGGLDCRVPQYHIEGPQLHEATRKDKSWAAEVDVPSEWNRQPRHPTRSALLAARRAERVPHRTFDVDGDGVVGALDCFIASSFDRDRDGRLSTGEQQKMNRALSEGWLDKFSTGLERGGPNFGMPITQRRGLIVTNDTTTELTETYPHPAHEASPAHATRTELQLHRLAEARNFNHRLAEAFDVTHPAMITEPPVRQEGYVENPRYGSIHERANADHRHARVKAGLHAVGTELNPERSDKSVTTGYVDQPAFQTRADLLQTRRERIRLETEDQRMHLENTFIPRKVHKTLQFQSEYAMRQPTGDGMTLTKLKRDRRIEATEHSLKTFAPKLEGPSHPKFSDSPDPFWKRSRHQSMPHRNRPVTPPSPVFKITDAPAPGSPRMGDMRQCRVPKHDDDTPPPKPLLRAPDPFEPKKQVVKSWTRQMIEAQQTKNGKRLFDNLKPPLVQTSDFLPLEAVSSFECIRNQKLRDVAKAKASRAEEPVLSLIRHVPNRLPREDVIPRAVRMEPRRHTSATSYLNSESSPGGRVLDDGSAVRSQSMPRELFMQERFSSPTRATSASVSPTISRVRTSGFPISTVAPQLQGTKDSSPSKRSDAGSRLAAVVEE